MTQLHGTLTTDDGLLIARLFLAVKVSGSTSHTNPRHKKQNTTLTPLLLATNKAYEGKKEKEKKPFCKMSYARADINCKSVGAKEKNGIGLCSTT